MKQDISVIRLTLLLYLLVILIPFNYFYVRQSFESMRNDSSTMNRMVFLNGALQYLSITKDPTQRASLIQRIDETLGEIKKNFIDFPANAEYVALFRADTAFEAMKHAYEDIKTKTTLRPGEDAAVLPYITFKEVYVFSKTAENMMEYKINHILTKLYFSLTLTIIGMIVLIFLFRLYVKLQLRKHSVHDHVTRLYNRSYFRNALEHELKLANRRETSVSLMMLCITNYDALAASTDKKGFENLLQAFSHLFHDFFRRSDTVCRIEENCFVSITPDVNEEGVSHLCERLHVLIDSARLDNSIAIDLQIGCATYNKEHPDALLDKAREAMQANEPLSINIRI